MTANLCLFLFCLSFSCQEKIEAINQALVNEYEVRRKMLLKRLDVTVQSFGWSDRAKVRLINPPTQHVDSSVTSKASQYSMM